MSRSSFLRSNDLIRIVYEHKQKITKGFTSKYNVNKLVYFEETSDILVALNREKQVKDMNREKKIDLIISLNLEFKDVYENLILLQPLASK